ncbi:hypothetical protein OEB94_02555 [Streptomyces sp. ICN988]|uniref:hypothetical protein n=1 Tax=Streptomyces sp. ICN988 TaxID=2983765 RepID=UPI0021E43219|nr:hypothetical protein [Streptomyces sp. ICN988]MCV2458171.1 hypothetical protein [Streptomyces sp. ICN988]
MLGQEDDALGGSLRLEHGQNGHGVLRHPAEVAVELGVLSPGSWIMQTLTLLRLAAALGLTAARARRRQ